MLFSIVILNWFLPSLISNSLTKVPFSFKIWTFPEVTALSVSNKSKEIVASDLIKSSLTI